MFSNKRLVLFKEITEKLTKNEGKRKPKITKRVKASMVVGVGGGEMKNLFSTYKSFYKASP